MLSAAAIIYNRRYNLGFPGLEWLHPFDIRKFGRAWRELRRRLGPRWRDVYVPVDRAARDEELSLAHSSEYLASLRRSDVIAAALEVPPLRHVPAWALRAWVLRPMRWAVRGTVLAARAALERGVAVNLGGGFHHAKRDTGEGFCLYADVAVAVRQLRAEGSMAAGRRIAYVDLDAHQGNGVCHQFMDDRDVFIFDMYNPALYPSYDEVAHERIDCDVPLPARCGGAEYLERLRERLPGFLDSVGRSGERPLGIYNAGTDVVREDPMGELSLNAADVLERDLIVVEEFRRRDMPVLMVTSGGYTRESWRLIAASVEAIVRHV
jgi:histone deacetylase 11